MANQVIELGPQDYRRVAPSSEQAIELNPSDVKAVSAAGSSTTPSKLKRIGASLGTFAGTVGREVGAGLSNIAHHPIAFVEGLIPGGTEAQKAYSHGLTPDQIETLSAPTDIGTLARFGLLTPERLEEEEAKARANAQQIANSPVRRAVVAGLSPEAAPLQIAEYGAAGRALGAAEEIPGVRRLVGEGARRAFAEGAAVAGGFQAAEEAKRAAQGQPNTSSQAAADILSATVVGGGLGAGLNLPDYFGRLRLRRELSAPLEQAEETPPVKALRVGDRIVTPEPGDIMHAQMWERLSPEEQKVAEPGWLYGKEFRPDPRTRPMRKPEVQESLQNLEAPAVEPEDVRTVQPPERIEPAFQPVPASPAEPVRYSGGAKQPPAPTEAARLSNLFGPGFYTADLDTAQRAAVETRGRVYQVRERPGLRMLNLDEPLPSKLRDLAKHEAPDADPDQPSTFSPELTAKLGQAAEAEGYAGFERGGARVYFNPARDVTLAEPTDTSLGALESYPGATIRRVAVSDIKAAPELYQYKIGSNAEGAGLALNKAKRFNERLAGVVTLIPDAENPGKFYVVNGHQRLSLAKRTGQEALNAQILPAGTSPAEARAIGARINIAEGRGTPIDAAKFMRDTGTTPEQLASEGIDLSESTAADAMALSHLSDSLFREVATGRMREGRGVVLGRELAGNAPAQEEILKTVRDLEAKGQSVGDAKLAELIRIAKGSATVSELQTDLFGARELKRNLAPQQADILAYARENLARDKRLFGTVVRHRGRLEAAGTQVGAEQASGISQGAAARIAVLDATAYAKGTATNSIVRLYAEKLAASPKGARVGILQDAYREIYGALEKDFGAQAPLAGVTPQAGPGQGMLLAPQAAAEAPAITAADVQPVRGKGYTDLGVAVIPGLHEFIERDVVPTATGAVSAANETRAGLKRLFAPASAGEEAFAAAAIVSRRRAELANDRAVVQRGIRTFERYMAPMPDSVKDDFIDRIERGKEQATPELQKLADSLRVILDKHRDEIQELGRRLGKPLLEDFYQNYFPHIWKDPKGVEEFYQSRFGPRGSLSGRGSFLKKRTFDYYSEARAAGFEPLVDNPVTLVAIKGYEMAKYASGVRIMEDLKNGGLLKFVRYGEQAPAGYSPVNDKLARVFRPAEVMGREVGEAIPREPEMFEPTGPVGVHETFTAMLPTGQWHAPDDVVRIIDRYLSPGLRSRTGETPTNAYDAVRAASNVLNQVQLGMSAFHVTTTTANSGVSELALAIQKAERGDIKGAAAGFIRATPGVGLMQDLFGPGRKMYRQFYGLSDYGPRYQKAVTDYIKSGAHFEQSRQFIDNWTDSFRDAIREGNILGAGARAPFAVLEQLSKPIFQYIVPRAKAAAFLRLNEFEQAKLPATASELDRIKVAYQVQNSMDNRFGELLYDKLFWDNRWRDIVFAAGRAPGWLLGTIRELGGGVTDILGGKGLTGRAAYTIALPIWTALWGSVLQYATIGTLPRITEDARETFRNLFAPIVGTDPDGKPIRVWLPTYMKEVYHLGAALHDLYYGAPAAAGRYLASKLNPAVQLGSDIITNRAYPDVQVRDPEAPLREQVAQVARTEGSSLLPFTVQNLLRERQAGASAASAGTLSSFGITPAPRSLSQTSFENYLDRKVGGHTPEIPKTEDDAKRFQRRREAIAALRRGQSVDLGGFGKSDLDYIRREASAPPLVDRAMRLSLPELVDGLRYATPEEKAQLVIVINRKLKGLKNLTPEKQEHIVNQLNATM